MSGIFISTGLITNIGDKKLVIEEYLNKTIKDLSIHVIPLSPSETFRKFQIIGTIAKMMTPMIFNPSLTHVAIQLNLEGTKDIIIIEYGQYLTKDSDLKIFSGSSSNSSNEARENKNENIYYYINKDGARITLFTYERYSEYESF